MVYKTPCSRGHTSNLNVNRSTNKANHRNHSTVAVNTYASNSNSQSLLSSHLCFRYLAPPRRPLRVPPWLRCAASSARHRPCWVTGRRPAAAGWPPGRWREPAAPATALPPPRRRPPRRPPVYQEKLSQTMCGCCEGSRLSHEHCSAAAATSPSAPPPCDCRGHRCRGVSTHVGVKRHCIMQRQYKPAGIESAARACVPVRPTGTARRQTLPPFQASMQTALSRDGCQRAWERAAREARREGACARSLARLAAARAALSGVPAAGPASANASASAASLRGRRGSDISTDTFRDSRCVPFVRQPRRGPAAASDASLRSVLVLRGLYKRDRQRGGRIPQPTRDQTTDACVVGWWRPLKVRTYKWSPWDAGSAAILKFLVFCSCTPGLADADGLLDRQQVARANYPAGRRCAVSAAVFCRLAVPPRGRWPISYCTASQVVALPRLLHEGRRGACVPSVVRCCPAEC